VIDSKKEEVTLLVKSLSGVIKVTSNEDHKNSYKKHLNEKYSN